jgi:DNA-directed RNA polymerase specialized sigma24 family protein
MNPSVAMSTTESSAYERLRRAICDRDDAAWHAVVDEYYGMVRGWVRAAPGYHDTGDEDALVAEAFERFWFAVQPQRFDQFHTLASLLRYLKVCAGSCVLDQARSRGRRQHASLDELLDRPEFAPPSAPDDVQADVESRFAASRLWRVVEHALPDPLDRQLVYLSDVLGLLPAAISARHPDVYPSAYAVYQHKDRVKARLRRFGSDRLRAGAQDD